MNVFHCNESLGFCQLGCYVIKKAIKPKGQFKRWKKIGRASCDTCIEYFEYKSRYEYNEPLIKKQR